MQIYIDNDENTITVVQSVASASTMISSVANEAVEYVKSKFPPRFFKHTFIDTSQTVTQRAYNEKYNKTANKIPYPSISVTPVLSLDDPIGGMEKSLHMSSPNLYIRKDIDRSTYKLVVDPDKQFSIHYSCDYITTNFDFKITVNTYIQNVNTAMYLKSRFQAGFFQYLNHRYIQTEIPKSLIAMIADIKGYDLSNSDDMDALRLYLIGTSRSEDAIQKKVNFGTGKECFFINKPQNILALFTDLDCPPSVIKDGQAEGEYTINFRLQISAWIPNTFILHINKSTLYQLSHECICMLDNSDSENNSASASGVYSSSFHNVRLVDGESIRFLDNNETEQIGQLVYKETFTNTIGRDNTDIYVFHDQRSKFKDELSKVIAYACDNNLDLSSVIHMHVYSNDGKLHYKDANPSINDFFPDDYSIDYKTMAIHILNSEYARKDLCVMVYVNRLAYDSLKEAMEKDAFYFNSNVLTHIYGKTSENTPVKLIVKSFANSKEISSSDIAYALRINTAYGIGYVSISDIDSDSVNAYKICVGKNADGTPIIKKLDIQEV